MDRKSTIAFSISPILVSALGFVFTPILSHWLAEDDMAKFAIFQTNSNFFALIVGLGLDQAIAREFHEAQRPSELMKRVLRLIFIALPLGLLGLLLIRQQGHGLTAASITITMALASVLMLFNRMYSAFIRMSGNGIAYGVDIVGPKAFQLFIIALIGSQAMVELTYEVVVGIFVISTSVALCYEIIISRRIGRAFDADAAKRQAVTTPGYAALLKFSMPLVPGALAYYAISACAIYVVGAYGSPRDVVVTSLAISVGGGVAVLQSVFATMWTPFAYRWHAQNGSPMLYSHIATLVTMACAVLLLGSFLVIPYISLLFPKKYSGLTTLVALVIVWNLLTPISYVGRVGIGVKRASFAFMTISIIGAVLSIGMSILGVQYFGAIGSLQAVLLAFIVNLVLNCEYSTKGWQRILSWSHYLMVGIMTVAGLLFSLGYAWESELILLIAIFVYVPRCRLDYVRTLALYHGHDSGKQIFSPSATVTALAEK